MSENEQVVSDTPFLTREAQLAMWLKKKNEKVEKPNPLTPINVSKVLPSSSEEFESIRKVLDLSQLEITPFKGTKKSMLKSQTVSTKIQPAVNAQPTPLATQPAHNATPFRHILNVASNSNTSSAHNATPFRQPQFTHSAKPKPESQTVTSSKSIHNATPFRQPQFNQHAATPFRQPQSISNSHVQTPFKAPTLVARKPDTPHTFWTQKEWAVKDQCQMALDSGDYETGHKLFDAIHRKHKRWIKSRAFFWLTWGKFEENFSQMEFAIKLYEMGILNEAQPPELINDALNRVLTGKDENNKTIFEIEEEVFSTTIDMIQPTFMMSPAKTFVRPSPKPSPRLNNLRLLGTPTGGSKGPALRVPKILEKLNFEDINLDDINDGLELDNEQHEQQNEVNEQQIEENEQQNEENEQQNELNEHNDQQEQEVNDRIVQQNEYQIEESEYIDELMGQSVQADERLEERDTENVAPSLNDCRNVLQFLSANNIPIAGYLLRTYNDFKTIDDMKELITTSHANNNEGEYESNNNDDVGTDSITGQYQPWEDEEDSEVLSEDDESDEEDSMSLSQIICEQLSSYGHTYIYSGLRMSTKKKGNVIPSTPVRRSHRLLKTPHK